jgi:hypothetical protein
MNSIRSSLGHGAPRTGLRATPTPVYGLSLGRDNAVGERSDYSGEDAISRSTPTRRTNAADAVPARDPRAGHRTRPRTAPDTGAVPGGGAPRPPRPYREQSRTRPGGSDTVFRADLE